MNRQQADLAGDFMESTSQQFALIHDFVQASSQNQAHLSDQLKVLNDFVQASSPHQEYLSKRIDILFELTVVLVGNLAEVVQISASEAQREKLDALNKTLLQAKELAKSSRLDRDEKTADAEPGAAPDRPRRPRTTM